MLKQVLAGIATSVIAATVMAAQGAPQQTPPAGAAPAGAPGGGGGGRGGGAEAADRSAVGGDVAQGQGVRRQGARRSPATIPICSSTSASSARRRAARRIPTARRVGVPNSEPKLTPYPGAEPGAGRRRPAAVRQLLLDRQHRHRRVADHVGRRLHPVRHDEQRGRREEHHHPGDGEAEARPDEDQVPGLRPQPLRSHRRRRIHPAADRRQGGDAPRRLGDLPEEHRPRRRRTRPRPRRRRRRRRGGSAATGAGAGGPAAEDEARHRRHRRHGDEGRRQG